MQKEGLTIGTEFKLRAKRINPELIKVVTEAKQQLQNTAFADIQLFDPDNLHVPLEPAELRVGRVVRVIFTTREPYKFIQVGPKMTIGRVEEKPNTAEKSSNEQTEGELAQDWFWISLAKMWLKRLYKVAEDA